MCRSALRARVIRWASKWKSAAARGIRSIKYSRAIWAWALYDFANSPFSTTITTVVFNVYFAQVVARDFVLAGDALWGILVAAATFISGLVSPVIGALADLSGWRKRLLGVFAFTGAVCTAALVLATPQTLALTSVLFVLASVSFSCSFTFYNAFLNDLAQEDNIGRISGLGWALGYLGGGGCLALNLLMIQKPQIFSIAQQDYWPVRLSFLVVGLWWFLFSLPVLLWIRDRPKKETVPAGGSPLFFPLVRQAFSDVVSTLRSAGRRHRNSFRFIMAYLLYNDGIETVIVMASLFSAQVLGMQQAEIIQCFLMIQFVAFIGALVCGKLGDWLGNKRVLSITLWVWSATLLWALFMKDKIEFWIAGALIGLIMGGSQSLSRSLFAKTIPKESESQFYGFLNLSSKISATLGPLTYAISRQITGSPRWAILSMLVFFLLGQWLLAGVRESGAQPLQSTRKVPA